MTVLLAMAEWACDSAIDEPDEPLEPVAPRDSTTVTVKRKVSIIGDSCSTFEGWSNKDVEGNDNGYYVYYPYEGNTDVTSVERTWWYMLCQLPEFELEVSNSFSGSVISNSFYNGMEVAGTDLTFMHRIGKNSKGVDYNGDPDIIIVMGGTNDCWAGVKLGNYVYEEWTDDDLKCFRPAFSKLLSSLREYYPEAKVYNVTYTPGLTASYIESIQNVCRHHDVPNLILKNVTVSDGHPTYAGMLSICRQVYYELIPVSAAGM